MVSKRRLLSIIPSLIAECFLVLSCKTHVVIPEAEADGIWETGYFVDSFGDETQEAYIKTKTITGTLASYREREASVFFLYNRDESGDPLVGIMIQPVPFSLLDNVKFKVSANGMDSFTFESLYDPEGKRFVLSGEIAEKMIGVFSTADTLRLRALHTGVLSRNEFFFETDSLSSGFIPVYNRYERIFKERYPDLEINKKK